MGANSEDEAYDYNNHSKSGTILFAIMYFRFMGKLNIEIF